MTTIETAAWTSLAFAAALTLAAAPGAAQQPTCNERTDVLGHLAKKYGEVPVAVGVTNKGGLVEVLTTGDGDTWTIIVSTPNGMSCMLAAGEGWRTKDYDGAETAPST